MEKGALMHRVERVVEQARTAVLTTVDADGRPHARWMTPAILHGREGLLYAVTAPGAAKLAHLAACPHVDWLIQTPDLKEVINLQGRVNVVDNPSLAAEITEAIGRRLETFWTAHVGAARFVVLETVVEAGVLYYPMTGERETWEGRAMP